MNYPIYYRILQRCNSLKDRFCIGIQRQYDRGLCLIDSFLYHNHPSPTVKSIEETLQMILKTHCSVARFGDGEIKFVVGKESWFQPNSPLLEKKISKILREDTPGLIVCIQDIFNGLGMYTETEADFWRIHLAHWRRRWYNNISFDKIYYNTSVSRCYLCQKDKVKSSHYFGLWKEVWNDRDILIIEGEKSRLGVGNDLFDNARSIRRMLAPNIDAFRYYNQILETVSNVEKSVLILLALGPTATILASDFCKMGFQAIDIGHIDIEYEWMRMGVDHKVPVPGKFVNEAGKGAGVGVCLNERYKKQIINRFGC